MMSPDTTALWTLALLLLAAAAAFFILEAQGRLKPARQPKPFIWAHRACGWAFSLAFSVLGVLMIVRSAGYQREFSNRILLHVALAISMALLLLLKILIARRYRRYFAYLPAIGGLLLTAAAVVTALTAGHYYLQRGAVVFTEISPDDAAVLDPAEGRSLTWLKCGKCHSLERVLRASKDRTGWTRTVNRMALMDAPDIRPFDVKQIIDFLSTRRAPGARDAPQVAVEIVPQELTRRKCARCHPLERVFEKSRTPDQWRAVIEQMVENAAELGEYDFLSSSEKRILVDYLAGLAPGRPAR